MCPNFYNKYLDYKFVQAKICSSAFSPTVRILSKKPCSLRWLLDSSLSGLCLSHANFRALPAKKVRSYIKIYMSDFYTPLFSRVRTSPGWNSMFCYRQRPGIIWTLLHSIVWSLVTFAQTHCSLALFCIILSA